MVQPASLFNRSAEKNDIDGMKKALSISISDYELYVNVQDFIKSTSVMNKWLVHNQFGGTEASVISLKNYKRSMKLLPFGGVARRVPTIDDPMSFQGMVYCFLPLPIKSTVPVSINVSIFIYNYYTVLRNCILIFCWFIGLL
jgi:hypothetical protein